MQGSGRGRGYAIAIASAAVLSSTAPFIRHLTLAYRVPALVLALWRDVLVAAVLGAVLAAFRPALLRLRRADVPLLLGYGAVLAVFNCCWTLSVALTGAALATVLAYSSAVFSALLGWWLFREPLGVAKALAVLLCVGGCALVAGLPSQAAPASLAGVLLGVASGLCYAAYGLLGRAASRRGLSAWTTVLYAFGIAGAILLALDLLAAGWLPGAPATAAQVADVGGPAAWAILFALAAGPTVLGFGLYNVALTWLPASTANLVLTLEPLFTAAIAYLALGERLTPMALAGSGLILAGVLLVQASE
ncbi:MAG: DMT family transporter [Deltaproteobacteria bacterium]|nr:DMT family transporter [Deltaproteobacteria bacterium]